MIDCPNGELRDLLPDYLHDRLDASNRASVERHLATCTACQDELALLRDLRGTLHRAPRIDVAAVAAAIPAYRPAARERRATGWRVAAAIAAIAIGGASITLLRHGERIQQTAQAPIAVPTTQTPTGSPTGMTQQPAQQPASPREAAAPAAVPVVKSAPAPSGEELAMAAGTIADLSDGELSDLLGELESLDAVPSADVESTESFLAGRHRGRHD